MKPQFGALVNNLVVMTDRSIMGLRTASNPSAGSSSQGTNSRTAPVPLVWSVALRVSRDITIQAAVEYVDSLPILTLFICLTFRIGRIRAYIDLTDKPNLDKPISIRILA